MDIYLPTAFRWTLEAKTEWSEWVRTGDEVVIGGNSDVFAVDGLEETVKVFGFQVAPAESKGRLLDHAHVFDSTRVNRDRSTRGSRGQKVSPKSPTPPGRLLMLT